MAAAFARARREGRAALIPYLTAGHPTRDASLAALRAVGVVADLVEVGIPFSDPVADGPIIQRSSQVALDQGMTVAGVLALVERAAVTVPVVMFSYLNPVLRYGLAAFVRDAAAAGASSLLLTDLPDGTADPLAADLRDGPLDLVPLVAPTTTAARLETLVRGAEGFVYLVARLGVTGVSDRLAPGLAESIRRVRAVSPVPVAAGFGIGTPDHAAAVAREADGIVVGSAVVACLERHGLDPTLDLLRSLRTAARRPVPAGQESPT